MTTDGWAGGPGPAGPLRVGLLGSGRMGVIHASNLRRQAGVFLAAVAVSDSRRAAAVAADSGASVRRDWVEVVEDPAVDAVVVASATGLHTEQILAASRAGKHIFCEKPVSADLEDAARAVRAAEEAGVLLHIGFQRRHDPSFRALHEELAARRVGDPWLLRISSRDLEPPPPHFQQSCGGLFVDMAIHDFDMARFLMGEEVVEISALSRVLVGPGSAEEDADVAVTTLVFESGALGVIENCRQSAPGYDQRVEIHGRSGTLSVENEPRHGLVVADSAGLHRPPWPEFFTERYAAAYVAELETFVAEARRRVAGEVAPAATGSGCERGIAAVGADGLRALELALAADRSARERRPVRLA